MAVFVDGVGDEFVDVVDEYVFGDGECAFVGVAPALDELGFESFVGHGL